MPWLVLLVLAAQDEAPPRVYLGVSFSDNEALEVGSVVENSPAEKGGIRAGDKIASVDGKKLDGFDSLIDVLRRHKKGDVIAVVVERGKTGRAQDRAGRARPAARRRRASTRHRRTQGPAASRAQRKNRVRL